mgnify:FL=1|tara:strand:+ start:28525 stop:29700 length:1176 start_codon:yes stop_codon:yes gene_type:complete
MKKNFDICIVGGLGHVGLPLGIVFASKGFKVCLQDINKDSAEIVKKGSMPFVEYGAEPLLKKALEEGNLSISLSPESISQSKHVIICLGTPIDEFMNPKTKQFIDFIDSTKQYLDPSQTIIIRSSVAPRTCEQVLRTLGKGDWKLSYCPERIVQGYAVQELEKLPQIVSGFSEEAVESASDLFKKISSTIIKTTMDEAEMAKLFSNSWRYLQFAMANQFYMICEDLGIDYDKVRFAMVDGYERASQIPSAGFAAGPCLLKDTMQISSIYNNGFLLGHSAMMINEGLPNYLVSKLRSKYDLKDKLVGILGMAFKANVDDIRDSLSFKLLKILKFHGAKVLCSDEFVSNPEFVTKEEVLDTCDIVIIGTPHDQYKNLKVKDSCEVIDLWNIVV